MATKTIDFKKFEKAVNDFNTSKVIKKKVELKPEDVDLAIMEAFLSAVESVPEEKESELPDSVIDMYNVLATAQEKEMDLKFKNDKEFRSVEEEKPKKKTGKKTSSKKAPAKKTKKEKVEEKAEESEEKEEKELKSKEKVGKKVTAKKKSAPKKEKPVKKAEKAEKEDKNKTDIDELGARIGSGTAKINEMLFKGATLDEIAGSLDTPIGRVKNHLYALSKKKGVTFEKKGKKGQTYYKIIDY